MPTMKEAVENQKETSDLIAARIRAYSVMTNQELALRLIEWADGLTGEYLPVLLKECASRLYRHPDATGDQPSMPPMPPSSPQPTP
jgi:hypothetical protein